LIAQARGKQALVHAPCITVGMTRFESFVLAMRDDPDEPWCAYVRHVPSLLAFGPTPAAAVAALMRAIEAREPARSSMPHASSNVEV
jgi:hypothetical protein